LSADGAIEARGSGAELDVAFGAADEGVKAGFVTALDGEVEADAFEGRGEFLGIGAHDFKIIQGAFCGCIPGRVDRVGAPFNEEGEEAVAVVGEVDRFPVEDAPIGTLSGAVVWAFEFDFVFLEQLRDDGDIRRMNGPPDEAWIGQGAELRVMDDLALRGIGSDDFQIATLTERKESISRAAAGVNAAEGGTHAGGLFDEFDAAVEIIAAEKDVIEQGGHVIVFFGVRGQGNRRNRKGAACEREELPARKI